MAATYGGGSAGNYAGFDALGRTLRKIQQTDSVNYLVEASYNVSGAMTSETYPSVPGASDRRTITFGFDTAGRLGYLNSNATSYAPLATVTNITYASHGALGSETYGNGLVHAAAYNNRLQVGEIKLGTSGAPTSVLDLVYNYGTTTNNGDIQSVSYTGGGLSYTQSFTYDSLNRLTTSQENSGASWSQTNSYDRYGNRSIAGGGLSFDSNNRMVGYSYDASGNLLNDGINSYGYDAEGRIKTINSTTSYTYDGEGHRVRKFIGENIRFVYGIGGGLIAEFDGATGSLKKEYLAGGGTAITIEPTNGTRYLTSDTLASPRVVTNSSGAVVSRHDYMPFGEELFAGTGGRTTAIGYSAADNLRQKFTGYQRDGESGLDFAQARYYASTQGRFNSPDPYSGSMIAGSPQSFNRYAYVGNNPVNVVDPTGQSGETAAAGSLPGAEDALGRAKPGEGVDTTSATDGSDGQLWMMAYGGTDAEVEAAQQATVVGLYATGKDGDLFERRATQNSDVAKPFDTGQQLIDDLVKASKDGPIGVVKVFDHGFSPGIIGGTQNNWRDVPKADRMAENTYNRLDHAADIYFLERHGRLEPVPWGVISGIIHDFNAASSEEEKRYVLMVARSRIDNWREARRKAKAKADAAAGGSTGTPAKKPKRKIRE